MNETLPHDAIVANGAGNATIRLHRFRVLRGFRTARPDGRLHGLRHPAAVAAKLARPDRVAVRYRGDGCILMTAQELATATQYGASILTIVVNNAMLATIRMHQERRHPGRVIATDLWSPDFTALARAYGGEGERVERTEDFALALARALEAVRSDRSHPLELKLDPEALTRTPSDARAQGEKARR